MSLPRTLSILDRHTGDQQQRGRFRNLTQTGTLVISSLEKSKKLCHLLQNKRFAIHKVWTTLKNRNLVFLPIKSIDQPSRGMDSERSFTFPYRGNDVIQGPITSVLT
jgi:hypothetical protein